MAGTFATDGAGGDDNVCGSARSFKRVNDVECLVVGYRGGRSCGSDTLQQSDDVGRDDLAAALAMYEGVGRGTAADDGDAGA